MDYTEYAITNLSSQNSLGTLLLLIVTYLGHEDVKSDLKENL